MTARGIVPQKDELAGIIQYTLGRFRKIEITRRNRTQIQNVLTHKGVKVTRFVSHFFLSLAKLIFLIKVLMRFIKNGFDFAKIFVSKVLLQCRACQYLREIKTKCEKHLSTRIKGPRKVRIQNGGQKYRDTVPFIKGPCQFD